MSKTRISIKTVSHEFSRRAAFYEEHASVQRQAAERLCSFIQGHMSNTGVSPGTTRGSNQGSVSARNYAGLPEPFLEVGCGTGLLSEMLIDSYPHQSITFVDVSQAMLDICAFKLRQRTSPASAASPSFTSAASPPHQFLLQDIELPLPTVYGTIFSSFALQWVNDLEKTVTNLLNALTADGAIFLCLPVHDSFPEWRHFSSCAGVACTANPLPRLDTMQEICQRLALNMEHEHYSVTSQYPSSLSFFRSLKSSGAALSLTGESLPLAQMKTLMREWDKSEDGICVTYSILMAKLARKAE